MDVKETKEALIGVNELSLFMIKRMKDGVGVDDITALWAKFQGDVEFSNKLNAAYEGISKVPEEVKDINLSEGIELGAVMLEYLPQFVEAFKG